MGSDLFRKVTSRIPGSQPLPRCPHPHLMSSSLAKMMTALALEVSRRRRMILSNSPAFGSRGIFTDWAIHTLPAGRALVNLGQSGEHKSLSLFTRQHILPQGEQGRGLSKVPSLTPSPCVIATVQILVPPLTSRVILDMSLKFSVPQFPYI